MNDKITASHLDRCAFIYIRQSTLQQVHHNVESNRRQYALAERAKALGFASVVVVDEDLGISGAGTRERPGFTRLLAAVCNGDAGAVFALEASRLARNNRDWHHLIDLCVLTRTLVVDADGIYDPRLINDRLLLGLKGTMSEFELGLLRQRAQEAYRQKAFRGEVMTRVPVGFVRMEGNGIAMTPDRQVQEAIRSFFQRLRLTSSLRQALLWYHQEKTLFPVCCVREGHEILEWRLPNYQQLLRLVKNPVYAGAFAWGRTAIRSRVADGRSRKTGGHQVGMDQWQVLLKDHHPGYIVWEEYLENLHKLVSNRTKSHQTGSGAARKGCALLAGLLRCGHCGHKLHVSYRGGGDRAARYTCLAGVRERGETVCLSFGGLRVENAIVAKVLEACSHLGVEASLRAMEEGREEQSQKRKALELALEKAKYEERRSSRQYNAADPDNRLVTAELENRWNAALIQVAELESRLAEHGTEVRALDPSQRERMLRLGSDLQALWNEETTSTELKKQVLRTVINEVVAGVDHDSGHVELKIHWTGGAHTQLRVRKNRPGENRNATSGDIVGLVRELAAGWNDGHIASMLNRSRLLTGKGNTWNETRVKNLRRENGIPVFSKSSPRPWKTMLEAASLLGVSNCVIRTMVRNKILPARHVAKWAPWMIDDTALALPAVINYVRQARTGKKAPCDPDTQLLDL